MTSSTEVPLCALDVFKPWILEPNTYKMGNGEVLNLCILTEASWFNSEAVTHTCSHIRTISVHFMKHIFKQLNCYKKASKNQKSQNQ